VANGITWAADNGADVVNLSLGILGVLADPGQMQTLEAAVDYAWDDRGVVVVAATGNDGVEAEYYPAGFDNAKGVASSNRDDYHSCFSNTGIGLVSVSAPGEAIYSSWLRDAEGKDGYKTGSGTSASTPHVSGLAGLLLSNEPTLTNDDVRARIEATADDLGPQGVDIAHGWGRINAHRALDTSHPPHPRVHVEPISTFHTASGYAHARKLVRDDAGTLHLVWHTHQAADAEPYQIHYATSANNGQTWTVPIEIFASSAATYHPALAIGNGYLYAAFPSLHANPGESGYDSSYYRTWFTRRELSADAWQAAKPVIDVANYDAVRPDLHFDASADRLHLVASAYPDHANHPYVHYTWSGNAGTDWATVQKVNPTTAEEPPPADTPSTSYATVHGYGPNVYIVARTVYTMWLLGVPFSYYYTRFIRSTDGGQSWFDRTQLTSYWPGLGDYGLSLAGVGDSLYMGYEVGGNLYFRSWPEVDDQGNWVWSEYVQLESSGQWPTITQADDGQAWLIWEDDDNLHMRHYTGSVWEGKETLPLPANLSKGIRPNLKLGTSGNLVEWVTNYCPATPFQLVVASRDTGEVDLPPTVDIVNPTDGSTVNGDVTVQIDATDDVDPAGTLSVEWNVDGGAWQPTTYNSGTDTYEANWDSTSTSDGAHTINAQATDSASNVDGDSNNVTVDNINEPPMATFTYDCSDLSCAFDASGSSDPDGTIESWDWDFGDTNTGTGETASHTYAWSGTYPVILTVTDDGGETGTATQDVSVTAPNTVHVGDLDGEKHTVRNKWVATVTITVHDASHGPVSGATVSGQWSTGVQSACDVPTGSDGTCTVSLPNISKRIPSVDFAVSDIVHTALTYSPGDNHDPDGESDGTTITVPPPPPPQPPVAQFSYSCNGLACQFYGSESYDPDGGAIIAYAWDFGDGGTSAVADPPHTFSAASTYPVTLVVTDDEDQTDDDVQDVTVSEGGTDTMGVSALTGTGAGNRNFWKATVTITVQDNTTQPVANATVYGVWSGGASGSSSCLTDSSGECSVTSPKSTADSITFTVMDVTHATLTFDDIRKSITVYRP
jgi:PKD repeat protein